MKVFEIKLTDSHTICINIFQSCTEIIFITTLAFGSQLLSIINTSVKFDWLRFIGQIVKHTCYEFEHFIFSFSYFSQLFVEIRCQEIVEKLISCYMVLLVKCLSTSFLFPPSVFHVYIIPVLKMISLSSYVAWQFTCVTFCLDHWYFIIQWSLITISSWNLCLPFLSVTINFLSQNSALSCVFESLPDLFTLL